MKKVNLKIATAIIVATTAIIFYSCRKENKNPQGIANILKTGFGNPTALVSFNNIVQENGYLYFKQFSDFENTMYGLDTTDERNMDLWESNFTGFKSMRTFYNALEDYDQSDTFLCPLFDESLATIVNQEGIIRVDSVAFLLDFATNSVYEVYPVNAATIDSLKLKSEINNDSMYLFKYSMDNEIFFPDDMVQQTTRQLGNGQIVTVNNSKRAFKFLKKWWYTISNKTYGCGDDGAEMHKDTDPYTYSDPTQECVDFKYKLKLKYVNNGIWFKIQAKAKHYKKDGCNASWKRETGGACFDGDAEFKKFCMNGIKNENHECHFTRDFSGTSSTFSATTYTTSFYSKGTKLAKYKVKGNFMLYDRQRDTALWTRQYEIKSNY